MEITLKAQPRSEKGKGPARRARASGQVPAVLYGSSLDPTPLLVDAKEMWHALHTEAGANVLITLQLDQATKFLTMAREIQRHPIKGTLLHVDFVNIARDVKISAEVPIHLVGESRGVKEGGQLDQHIHELKLEALPTDVPSAIEIDISDLGIGDTLRVSDIPAPSGAEIQNDPEEVVLAVIETLMMKVESDADEEAVAPEGEAPAAEGDQEAQPESTE